MQRRQVIAIFAVGTLFGFGLSNLIDQQQLTQCLEQQAGRQLGSLQNRHDVARASQNKMHQESLESHDFQLLKFSDLEPFTERDWKKQGIGKFVHRGTIFLSGN